MISEQLTGFERNPLQKKKSRFQLLPHAKGTYPIHLLRSGRTELAKDHRGSQISSIIS
jgi:hypothetical protein